CLRITLVIAASDIAAGSPYYLSFPNIQRTCTMPSWRDSVAVTGRCFFLFKPFLAIGSAKVRRSFEVASERGKFLFFFEPLFNSWPPPFEAGCKGKALFSTLASGAENLFF
ncbi:hypothetical protein ACFST9_07910, partial [Hymenobacter monticola]|uniref:hypothetical protein n=1 Tax=Hymenobacter monticola TaxID=1705399 RepID=UPI0036397AA2